MTNEGLQALGMQEEPQLSPEAMFHVSLTAKDLAIKKDFPDEFLLRKYRELFESTDPDEVAIFKKIRGRGSPQRFTRRVIYDRNFQRQPSSSG